MFLGLEWYWWMAILALLAVLIPFKVKFVKWWNKRQQGKEQHGKWGGRKNDRSQRFDFFLWKK